MDGPLKRSGLRSSPEDAALFKQHHEPTLAALRQGKPRDELVRELIAKGVPDKTAARILVAVEMENATAVAKQESRPGAAKAITYIVMIWSVLAVYAYWQVTRKAGIHWGTLIPCGVIACWLTARIVSRRLVRRRREPADLPPPK